MFDKKRWDSLSLDLSEKERLENRIKISKITKTDRKDDWCFECFILDKLPGLQVIRTPSLRVFTVNFSFFFLYKNIHQATPIVLNLDETYLTKKNIKKALLEEETIRNLMYFYKSFTETVINKGGEK